MNLICQIIPDEEAVKVSGGPGVGKRTWTKQARHFLDGGCHVNSALVRGPLWGTMLLFENEARQDYKCIRVRHVLLFDISDSSTLQEHLDEGMDEIREETETRTGAVLLVANKCDLVDEHNAAAVGETRRVARRLAEEGGFIYVETSATTGEGMAEALYLLLNKECQESIEGLIDFPALSQLSTYANQHEPLPL